MPDQRVVWDMFSGVGGFSLGFESAGFKIDTAVEFDPVHAGAHRINFPDCKTICRNMREFAPEKGVPVDVILSGAPCQSFSMESQSDPNDPRSTLSFETIRVVSKIKPKYVVLENVPAIAHKNNVHILDRIIEQLEAQNYRIVKPIRALNSQDFGVAQKRERLFILATRNDCEFLDYPVGNSARITVGEVLMDLADIPVFLGEDRGIDKQILKNHSILTGARNYNDFGKCIPREVDRIYGHLGSVHSAAVAERFAAAPPGKEQVSRFHKLSESGQCNTLKAGTAAAKGGHTASRPIHYEHPRCITVREAARLQGFPDWFQFHRTIWAGFRQVGNSVCPPVARAIAMEINKALDKEHAAVTISKVEATQVISVKPLKF